MTGLVRFAFKIVTLGQNIQCSGNIIKWLAISTIAISACHVATWWPQFLVTVTKRGNAGEQLTSAVVVTIIMLHALGLAVQPMCYALLIPNFRQSIHRVATVCLWRPHVVRSKENMKALELQYAAMGRQTVVVFRWLMFSSSQRDWDNDLWGTETTSISTEMSPDDDESMQCVPCE